MKGSVAGAESAARFGLERFAAEARWIFGELLTGYVDDLPSEIERLEREL